MKQTTLLLFATITLGLGSCQNEELDLEQVGLDEITVSLPSNSETRTTIGDTFLEKGYANVTWNSDDAISVFAGDYQTNYQYKLKGTSGISNAIFTGRASGTKTAALYPYSSNAAYNKTSGITFSVPSEYKYNEGNSNQAPMAALINSETQNSISFKSAGAIIAIIMNGAENGYTKATLSANVPIAGEMTISFDTENNPTMKASTNSTGSKKIAITDLNYSNKITLFYPVPIVETACDFTFKLYTTEGESFEQAFNNRTIEKGKLYYWEIGDEDELIGSTGALGELELEEPELNDAEDTYLIKKPEDFAWLGEQQTIDKNVLIMNDIDMGGYLMKQINMAKNSTNENKCYEISGDSKNPPTISNFQIETKSVAGGVNSCGLIISNSKKIIVKNLKIDNAKAINYTESGYAGILIGYGDSGSAELENITISNCIIKGQKKVGGLIGYLTGSLNMQNCQVLNSEISTEVPGGQGQVAAIIGYANPAENNEQKIINSSIKECTIKSNYKKTESNREFGKFIGVFGNKGTLTIDQDCSVDNQTKMSALDDDAQTFIDSYDTNSYADGLVGAWIGIGKLIYKGTEQTKRQ